MTNLTYKSNQGFHNGRNGFVALTSTIIMSVILIAVTFSLSTTGFFARFNILEGEYKEKSAALAEGCIDAALLKLALNRAYAGGETIDIGVDTCTIEPIVKSGTVYTIFTQGVYQNVYTNLEIVADLGEGGFGNDYAIWVGSTSCGADTFKWGGSDITVTGSVHANRVDVSGAGNTVSNQTEWVTNFSDGGGNSLNPVQVSELVPSPVTFDIADYEPGGAKALEAGSEYHFYDGDLNVGILQSEGWYDPGTDEIETGLYYVTGDVELNGDDLNGAVTFVTPKTIKVPNNNQDLEPYIDGLFLFSGKNTNCSDFAIEVSGQANSWEGIMYAPDGKVKFGGSNSTTVNGCVFGQNTEISGSDLIFTHNAGYCAGGGLGVGLPAGDFIESWKEVPNF